MQTTPTVIKAPTPPLSPRLAGNLQGPDAPSKLSLGGCEALAVSSAASINTLEDQLSALQAQKDSFAKGSEALKLLDGFRPLKNLTPQQKTQLATLINDSILPLCKKGFIRRDALGGFERFKAYIQEEHLSPTIPNFWNVPAERVIAIRFSQVLKQDPNLPLYQLNDIVTLLADHVNSPFPADFLRFTESYLLEPSLYSDDNGRPLLHYFLHHFVEKAAEYRHSIHLKIYNPVTEGHELCLNLLLNAKHLACCLELYSDACPSSPPLDEDYQRLLQKGLCYLIDCNNRLWTLLYQGFYDVDAFIYTLSTQLEFAGLLTQDLLMSSDEELQLMARRISLDAHNIRSGVIHKLTTLANAFRFGIPPLKPEMKNEAVAASIENYLNTHKS